MVCHYLSQAHCDNHATLPCSWCHSSNYQSLPIVCRHAGKLKKICGAGQSGAGTRLTTVYIVRFRMDLASSLPQTWQWFWRIWMVCDVFLLLDNVLAGLKPFHERVLSQNENCAHYSNCFQDWRPQQPLVTHNKMEHGILRLVFSYLQSISINFVIGWYFEYNFKATTFVLGLYDDLLLWGIFLMIQEWSYMPRYVVYN